MARAAHHVAHVGLALHADGFHAQAEVGPDRFGGAAWHPVLRRVGRIDLLDVEVLNVRPGVGEPPGHLLGAPQHHKRRAGQGSADHIHAFDAVCVRRLQPREVPDGWCAQTQVRVVRQQGHAGFAACARHHPVVGALAFNVAQLVGPALHVSADERGHAQGAFGRGQRGGRRCTSVQPKAPVQTGQISRGRGWLTRVRRKQLPQRRRVDLLQGGEPRELVAPVATEVQCHHERPAHAVQRIPIPRCPGLGPGIHAQQNELGRQRLGAAGKERIDAFAVGLQRLARIGRQTVPLPLSGLAYAQRAHELVGLKGGRAEHFRERSAHHAAVEFQLPAALLRVHIAHRFPGIGRTTGQDVRHIAGVAVHLHRPAQAQQLQLPVHFWQAALRVNGRDDHSRDQQHHQQLEETFDPAHGVSCVLWEGRSPPAVRAQQPGRPALRLWAACGRAPCCH